MKDIYTYLHFSIFWFFLSLFVGSTIVNEYETSVRSVYIWFCIFDAIFFFKYIIPFELKIENDPLILYFTRMLNAENHFFRFWFLSVWWDFGNEYVYCFFDLRFCEVMFLHLFVFFCCKNPFQSIISIGSACFCFMNCPNFSMGQIEIHTSFLKCGHLTVF